MPIFAFVSNYVYTQKSEHTLFLGDFMSYISKFSKNKIIFGIYLFIIAMGMGISYISDNEKVSVMPVYEKCIVIDAGHGGWDPGKVSLDAKEKDINLEISKKLKRYLEQSGCYILETRNEDISLAEKKGLDLKKRREIINRADNDMLISIHQNSFPKENVKGAQVFYHLDCEESKKLGECIQKRLKELDSANERMAKGNDSYYILREASVPAVIVECGFLSNKVERERLTSDEYQEEIAWCIYKGIIDYYST